MIYDLVNKVHKIKI